MWREFFAIIEPLQNQCIGAGRRLVSVMSDIRSTDSQGLPTRRQLYAQHRALSRALMDPELQSLRRKGQSTITRLQELEQCINGREVCRNSGGGKVSDSSSCAQATTANKNSQTHVANRLYELVTIFVEVDRAARRLEQLTEQRRERLREITRQRALEEEINEVIEIKKLFIYVFLLLFFAHFPFCGMFITSKNTSNLVDCVVTHCSLTVDFFF